MKTLLLLLTAVAVGLTVTNGVIATKRFAPPPNWYYNSPCQQPAGVSLEEWLPNLEWVPYEYGVYDCTEMSARIEWLAENCGYDAVIGCNENHCWVLIEGVAFEPTGNYWVLKGHDGTDDYYQPDKAYNSISIDPEWDWWKVHPELRSK